MATKKKAQAEASGTKTSRSTAAKKSSPAKKTPAKKATATGTAAKKTTAKKSTATKATAKKTAAKKSTATKAAAKKTAAKKTTATKAAAKKTAAKKTTATKATAKKATAKKTAAKKTAAKKSTATKAAAKKTATKNTAKKATAKNSGTAGTTASAAAPTSMNTKAIPPSKNPKPKDGLRFGSPDYPFDEAFLKAQTEQLLAERATLIGHAEKLRSEADALARDREPGDVQFDDESGEGDTLAVERDMDLARAASAMQTVEEIDAALERIEKGVYGICETSGLPIPAERLEAIPYARERVEYKTRSFR